MKNATQTGVALVEALVAILILAIGVLSAISLQMQATAAISDSRARAEATMAAEELIGIIWNNQAMWPSYVTGGVGLTNWQAKLTNNIPGATVTVSIVPIVLPSVTSGMPRLQTDITITWKRRATDDTNTHRILAFVEPPQ